MNTQPKTLLIIRGLPSSGKSTLAEFITPNYVEADMFHMKTVNDETVYDWKPENVRKSHEWCFEQVKGMMEMGESKIAVSNTFTRKWEFENYMELADEMGYRTFVLTTENYHGGVNSHDVPESTIDKMEERYTIRLRNKTVKVNG